MMRDSKRTMFYVALIIDVVFVLAVAILAVLDKIEFSAELGLLFAICIFQNLALINLGAVVFGGLIRHKNKTNTKNDTCTQGQEHCNSDNNNSDTQ